MPERATHDYGRRPLALSRLPVAEHYKEVLKITLGQDGAVMIDRYPHPNSC